ncbi:sce7725 family protein [Guptibacillus spartinae]|uniref:sce7725 family protein n=1 Tax=Guptibacillus spartinae TaxID=3025679 RepID=UPI002362CE2C|nr:sce7725 family protein [Pseudalkalibacillus spartinae]
MYLPYLRGRQYELLALRELIELDLISERINPIIEPIKPSATLIKTLKVFIDNEREISVIHNPKVGNFNKEITMLKKSDWTQKFDEFIHNSNITLSHIMNKNSREELSPIFEQGKEKNELLVINKDKDSLDIYLDIFNIENPKYNLIPDKKAFMRRVKDRRVSIANRFEKEARNSDYKDIESNFFSDDHLFFKEDGFIGFSDYSVVGEEYLESGFAPYAVAIHIVYYDEEMNLRIRHFVSESNDDISDPAGKFYEALEKLALWKDTVDIDTYGIRKFMEHYNEGSYPGLGTVKKLSIMHHIELISQYFDGVNKG